MTDTTHLRIVTYNIHRSRGMDGLVRPQRIARVLTDTNADIIALQEAVGPGKSHGGHVAELGAALGMGWVMVPTRLYRGHQYGNVVLSRFPIVHHTTCDLTYRQCEPRGVMRADLLVHGRPLHVFNVHLGTAHLERRSQAERLAHFVKDRRVRGPKILLGDFNEWLKGLTTELLSKALKSVDLRAFLKRRRTYPGVFPMLHLDHIYYDGAIEVLRVELPRSRLTLMASDHLPLVADVRLLARDGADAREA